MKHRIDCMVYNIEHYFTEKYLTNMIVFYEWMTYLSSD